jgi:hypothetical protein
MGSGFRGSGFSGSKVQKKANQLGSYKAGKLEGLKSL